MGIRLIKIAAAYLLIGVFMGMGMSISHNFTVASSHTHFLLLGWLTLGLAGIIYMLFPKAGETVLAKIHFWLNNVSLPVMGVGIFLINLRPDESAPPNLAFEPLAAIGGALTAVAIILFVVNLFLKLKNAPAEK